MPFALPANTRGHEGNTGNCIVAAISGVAANGGSGDGLDADEAGRALKTNSWMMVVVAIAIP